MEGAELDTKYFRYISPPNDQNPVNVIPQLRNGIQFKIRPMI